MRVIPYGVYDVNHKKGFVNLNISHDTFELAVNSITRFWYSYGKKKYPNAKKILILADCGGSNGKNNHGFKWALQQFCNATDLKVVVYHYPAGTSKWNQIEHMLFSQISLNWKGIPLKDIMTIKTFIEETTTKEGLTVSCEIDNEEYVTGIKIRKDEFDSINIKYYKNAWHLKGYYKISPQNMNDI